MSEDQYEEALRFWEENERTCDNAGNPPDCRYPEPQLSEFSFTRPFGEASGVAAAVDLPGRPGRADDRRQLHRRGVQQRLDRQLAQLPAPRPGVRRKLVTIVLFSALVSAAATGLALTAALVMAQAYDLPVGGLNAELGMLGRGVLVAVALAVLGFCIGTIGRHTAAAVAHCSATCSSGSSGTPCW